MKLWSAYPIRFLLAAICEKPETMTQPQRNAVGTTARRLLDFALIQTPRDDSLVRNGIEAVCRTFQSDVAASTALLRKVLPEEHLENYGFMDMPVLSHEVGRLIPFAPDLVRDIYIAIFSFDEERTHQTSMGPGRILPLTSTRRQDYNMAHYHLGLAFPAFLKIAPVQAIETLVAVVGLKAGSRAATGQIPEDTFDFNGQVARIQSDLSHIWDRPQHRHDGHLKMLDAFESELDRLAVEPNQGEAFERILKAVVEHNKWAAVWRHVLYSGIRNARTVGKELAPLISSVPILMSMDTSSIAGDFMKAVFPELEKAAREIIEKAIFSIPSTVTGERVEAAKRIRNRLLGCIPAHLIATTEVQGIIAQLATEGGPPANRPPFEIRSGFHGTYTEEHSLADQGVPTAEEPNRKIRELTEPIQRFVNDHSEKPPTLTETMTMAARVTALREAIENGAASNAHERQLEAGWTHLLSLCGCLARCEELDPKGDLAQSLRRILLEGAIHPSPAFQPERNDRFDDHTSWSPEPRIEAADGLLHFACRLTERDAQLEQAVEKLSVDFDATVRFMVADHLGAISKTAPELFDKLLLSILTRDPSSSVVHAALSQPLWRSLHCRPDVVGSLAVQVHGREDLKGKAAEDVRLFCISIFLNLFLWEKHEGSEKKIREICSEVEHHVAEAVQIVASIREILVIGPVETPEPRNENARSRAFQLFEMIVGSAREAFSAFQSANAGLPFSDWPEKDRVTATGLVQLLDSISTQLYFACGAFDDESVEAERQNLSRDQKVRFLREAGKLFDLLSAEPHPSTVHHLIETLFSLMELDPRNVFLRIVSIVKSGKSGGYQYESLAIGLIVDVVNRVFADFRPLLQDDLAVRTAMVEMIDIFVDVGWIQAVQLTYRLDEVFR
jgi:hypothetical protein